MAGSCLELLFLSAIQLNNLNFHPLEIVSRYRDQQLQVGANYTDLFNLRQNIFKS